MPIGKGTKKSGSAKSDTNDILEPMTQMTASQLGIGAEKKKKKTKKPKLTKAEKSRAKLEKSTDALRQSGQPYLSFMDRIEAWLTKHQKKAGEIFKRLDDTGEGAVSYDEFKSTMFDLNIPCNTVELHLLCQILDPDQVEEIDYLDLIGALKQTRERESRYTEEDIRPSLLLSDRKLNHCPTCKVAIWDGESHVQKFPRFVNVMLKLATFDNFREHRGHFNTLVHSHITVYGLMQIIIEKTQLHTTKLAIFTNKSRDVEAMLSPDISLEDCGFKGGPKDDPEELLLYYDYKVEFVECPILMCDHYFGQKVDVSPKK